MLKAANRLRHEKDIKTLFAKGKGVFDAMCSVKFRKNTENVSRFAVVVGTKVSKNAVERNRIRRRLRAVIEARIDQIAPGYDVGVLVRPEAKKADFAALEKALVGVLRRAKLLTTDEVGSRK